MVLGNDNCKSLFSQMLSTKSVLLCYQNLFYKLGFNLSTCLFLCRSELRFTKLSILASSPNRLSIGKFQSKTDVAVNNTRHTCNGNGVDRTSSVPRSVLCLKVDKGQGLWSGILFIFIHNKLMCYLMPFQYLRISVNIKEKLNLISTCSTCMHACMQYVHRVI